MVPWSERNTEAFAGLHNQGKRILLIFDEAYLRHPRHDLGNRGGRANRCRDPNHLGGLRQPDPQYRALPRNASTAASSTSSGTQCSWTPGRSASPTRIKIAKWIKSYGDDSDFRSHPRLRHLPPRWRGWSSFLMRMSRLPRIERLLLASANPLALGVDVARYGKNSSVIYPRKGRDARSYERERYQGLSTVQLSDRGLPKPTSATTPME